MSHAAESQGDADARETAASLELLPLEKSELADNESSVSSEETERELWSSHLDYMLSLVGFCVGLGNLWRFPYVCNRNGGGAFLIPFFFFLMTCGMPLFFLESAVGQFSGRSSLGFWDICPLFRGVGVAMNAVCAVTTVYYQVILVWALYYVIRSFAAVLPWTNCDNWWNTDHCFVRVGGVTSNLSSLTNVSGDSIGNYTALRPDDNSTYAHTSVEEYWQYGVLRISDGVGTLGTVQWELALCLLAAWVVVCGSVIRGVRSVGKVVYVTALLPYVLLTILLIRGLTLDGAVDGIIFYLKPDFKKLLEVQVWLEAAIQVFYSLGTAWGPIITYSSYSNFHSNCLRDSIVVCVISEGTSLYAGLVVFSVLGYMAKQSAVPVSEIVSSGPGLGFVAYPEAISTLPLPQLWAFLFFLMIFIVGLDTQFGTFETFMTSMMDTFRHYLKGRRVWITLVASAASFLLGLLNVTNGGIYLFQLQDWYVSPFTVLFTATAECFVVAWAYGIERFGDDLELMIGRRPPFIMKIMLCFISPLITTTLLVFTIAQYKPPTYGKYEYPKYAEIIGWFLAMLSFAAIPAFMLRELLIRKGSLLERLRDALKPTEDWKPINRKYHAMYASQGQGRKLLVNDCCSKA